MRISSGCTYLFSSFSSWSVRNWLVSPDAHCLGQDIVSKIKPCFSQGDFHLLFAWRLAFQVHKAPEDGASTVDMHPRGYPLNVPTVLRRFCS